MVAQAFPLGTRPNPLQPEGQAPMTSDPEVELLNSLPPNMMQKFQAEVAGLPPAQRQSMLMQLATDYLSQARVGRDQMSRGDAIRGQAMNMPEGRRTRGGYTAANPLEFVGKLAQQYQGKRMYDQGAQAQDEALGVGDKVRMEAMARALRQ